MTDAERRHWVTIKATGNKYEINEDTDLEDIEKAEPYFFRTSHGSRETYEIHRGQLIVRNTTNGVRRTVVYLVVTEPITRHVHTLCVARPRNSIEARAVIDEIIESGVTPS